MHKHQQVVFQSKSVDAKTLALTQHSLNLEDLAYLWKTYFHSVIQNLVRAGSIINFHNFLRWFP